MSQKNRDVKDSRQGIVVETAAASTARLQQEIDEHKKIDEALQESVLEMRTRNKILEIFHTTPDEHVYGELLDLVLEVFKSKFGTFGYFDQEGSFVIPSMTREIYWEKCHVPDKEIIFKKGTFSGIWARSIKERKTIYSNNGPFNTPKGHIPIKNTIVTPIIYHDRVISSIHLANKETDYDEGDRRLLETIANHIAPVLNARLQRDRLERERKQWEQAILRSEERLAHAEAIAHVGCWESDLNLQVEWWSDELYRIFGVDPETFTPSQESVSKLIPAEDLAVLNAAYQAAVNHGEPINLEHRVVRPDGCERWVHVIGRLERKTDGTPVRLFGTALDITERKKNENELERLYEQTRQDSETKTILLQEINHRVKNNLAMINSLLDIQAYAIKDPTVKSVLDNTRHRIYSMALVHEKIYQSENLSSINALEYFSSIITELNKAYGSLQRLIKINIKVDNVPLPLDYAIPCGLILNELLTNALKYAFPEGQRGGGEIIVEFHKKNNRFVLSVGDNGVGLPVELDFREAKSMGLRLINLLTRQIQGEINLDQSKGTLFRITFTAKGEKDSKKGKKMRDK
ncbi:MAG: PAS domain-containing protein [Candidatus Aminicenantes bacterium]|nr:MAG: PAS domain-containing protein [Candidatus Aminicenantes bacterium]